MMKLSNKGVLKMKYGSLYVETVICESVNERIELTFASCFEIKHNIDDESIIKFDFELVNPSTQKLIETILIKGYDFIIVNNGNVLFPFLDYWATSNFIPTYNQIHHLSNKITTACISRKDSEAQMYQRKVWLSVYPANTRHKRMRSCIFQNFEPLTGLNDLDKLSKAFAAPNLSPGYRFAYCILSYAKNYFNITNESFFTDKGIAVWTMGGAAKRYYLRLKYPDIKQGLLQKYQAQHPQNESFEYEMREQKLLLPGTLYLKEKSKNFGICYKYDISSLFPSVYEHLPELGRPIISSITEMNKDKTGLYEYIFVIDYIRLIAKKGLPPIFSNPFDDYNGKNTNYCEINTRWAVFRPFFNALLKFYNIDDIEISRIYKLPKLNKFDNAANIYANNLYSMKSKARNNGDIALSNIYKFFLNNLHGKFAQKTISEDYDYYINEDNILEKKSKDIILDDWKYKHFDYIRGAYIYSMARSAYFEKLLELFKDNENIYNHVFYIDTDSVVSDLYIENYMTNNKKMGFFKLEKIYKNFAIIEPKTYWGRLTNNDIDLVCAGVDKKYVLKELNKNMSDEEITKKLCNPNFAFYSYPLTRVIGGVAYVKTLRHLSAVNKI